MTFEKITEKDSLYSDLHKMSTKDIISNIHKEDQKAFHFIPADYNDWLNVQWDRQFSKVASNTFLMFNFTFKKNL